jgi:hypothetical protein
VTSHLSAFAALFAVLYVAHEIGDHWLQTHRQALTKGGEGWPARLADLRHVAVLTATKLALVFLAHAAIGLPVTGYLAPALALDAASHYWADRRTTLVAICRAMDRVLPSWGKVEFSRLGAPRPDHDDSPALSTGLYAMDQSWHIFWCFIAAR